MEMVQLSMLCDTRKHSHVLREVCRILRYHYPASSWKQVKKTFKIVKKLFEGRFPGYRACNTQYHDFFHTTDTLLAAARLVDGLNIKGQPVSQYHAVRILQAALLHDTGYIQKDWDTLGTGAKYTREHVERSKEFVSEQARVLGFEGNDIIFIARAIDSTGVNPSPSSMEYNSKDEQIQAFLLGAADLIAQMADRTYLEKLLFLYYEFREAGISGYETEFDIIRKTNDFYEIALQRFEGEFLGVHNMAQDHFRQRYSIDENLYTQAIKRNMDYIRTIIDDSTSNFRQKLHRISL
ncbi:MAG: hypothetical protein EHM28_06470 [Spirochaetaceae bacterium]|nr:MAG: hypothetical protein EHM28_06470 [Spirochaetaceae bacterium]